jgi:hypothetical protein
MLKRSPVLLELSLHLLHRTKRAARVTMVGPSLKRARFWRAL